MFLLLLASLMLFWRPGFGEGVLQAQQAKKSEKSKAGMKKAADASEKDSEDAAEVDSKSAKKMKIRKRKSAAFELSALIDTATYTTPNGKVTGDKVSVPPFRVLLRKAGLENYPCSDCHEDEAANPRERKLSEEHDTITLDHGGGRFWCLTCHGTKTKDTFSSLKGKSIDFDNAFEVCGQCHFQRQRDWYFGGHGKRVGAWRQPREVPRTYDALGVKDRKTIGSWKSPRIVFSCPACHDPHSPKIKPFQPSPPPKVRKGLLPRGKRRDAHPPIWERFGEAANSHPSPKGH